MNRKSIWSISTHTALAIALLLAIAAVSSPPARATTCTSSLLTLVAHQDDDLLFMNPDVENAIRGGACTTTVFLTAGDAGGSQSYWRGRELGPQSAYNKMLGLPSDAPWTSTQQVYAAHNVQAASSANGVSHLIYLRLPDGGLQGAGSPVSGNQSLAKLWDGRIGTITTVDGSGAYSRSTLLTTIAAIVTATNPGSIYVQDARVGPYDHSDHRASGQFAQEAIAGFNGTVKAYRGYNVTDDPANVTGAELVRKTETLLSYAAHDGSLCPSMADCPSGVTAQWNQRQYYAPLTTLPSPVPGPAPYNGPNLARNAAVLASSQVNDQEATKAIDAIISGWPANGLAEWSTNSQRAGAWLQLYWDTPQTIDRVILYDRPNNNDQITAGTLTFSDGTTVPVPALNNNGTATTITFTPRTTTTLRLTITSVSGGTQNIGLAEIEAYNG